MGQLIVICIICALLHNIVVYNVDIKVKDILFYKQDWCLALLWQVTIFFASLNQRPRMIFIKYALRCFGFTWSSLITTRLKSGLAQGNGEKRLQ